jgi:tRNA-dihydrouridine synthase A
MLPYIENEMAAGAELKHITRHMLGLFAGLPGARAWRRYLSENAHRVGGGTEVVETALAKLPQAA